MPEQKHHILFSPNELHEIKLHNFQQETMYCKVSLLKQTVVMTNNNNVTKLDLGLSTTNKQASEYNITPSESLAASCAKTGLNISLSVSCDSNVCANSVLTQHSVSPATLVGFMSATCLCHHKLSGSHAGSYKAQSLPSDMLDMLSLWYIQYILHLWKDNWKNTRQVKQASSLSIQSHMKSESILIMFKFSILHNLSSSI